MPGPLFNYSTASTEKKSLKGLPVLNGYITSPVSIAPSAPTVQCPQTNKSIQYQINDYEDNDDEIRRNNKSQTNSLPLVSALYQAEQRRPSLSQLRRGLAILAALGPVPGFLVASRAPTEFPPRNGSQHKAGSSLHHYIPLRLLLTRSSARLLNFRVLYHPSI